MRLTPQGALLRGGDLAVHLNGVAVGAEARVEAMAGAEIIDWFATQKGTPYQVWYIPKPNGSAYEIAYYQPQAKGAKYLGLYKGKELVDY